MNESVCVCVCTSVMRCVCLQDPSISEGTLLLDLVAAVAPDVVNRTMITPGGTPGDKELNAKYIISLARKIGASIFYTWEDIVEVNPKMVMLLVASLMQVALRK